MKSNIAKNATQVLIAAKWLIQNIGWTKRQYKKYNGNKVIAYCTSGAISAVKSYGCDRAEARLFIFDIIAMPI